MALKVIGTGFGRTGTDSMRHALNMLGFGRTHHMYEVIADPEQVAMWKALRQGATPDWDRLFDGYQSCVDWPSAYWWKDLVAHYPDAKVLLTYRSPESWWASFEKTILQLYLNPTSPDSFTQFLPTVFGGDPSDRDVAIRAYCRNVEEVKATIARERLLIHELGSGWEPLCAFLDVPVPEEPYPSGNNADEFHARAT